MVYAVMFEVGPVALVGVVVNDAEAPHGKDQTQCRVNQVTETVPGALIFQDGIAACVSGNDAGNHLAI